MHRPHHHYQLWIERQIIMWLASPICHAIATVVACLLPRLAVNPNNIRLPYVVTHNPPLASATASLHHINSLPNSKHSRPSSPQDIIATSAIIITIFIINRWFRCCYFWCFVQPSVFMAALITVFPAISSHQLAIKILFLLSSEVHNSLHPILPIYSHKQKH